jgi:DNA-directed RNA polymerase subunit RPC12/RpoP
MINKEKNMKKLIALALLLLMLSLSALALMPASAAESFDGWTPISSGADFAKIKSGSEASPNKYYLTKDITVDATVGSGWNPAPTSNVIIDGNGKTITLSKSLFVRVDNFTMQNVTLKGKIVWDKEPFMKSPITSGNGNTCGRITLTNVNCDVDMEMCFNHRYKRLAGVIYYTGAGSVLTNVSYTGNIIVKNSSTINSRVEVVGGIVANAASTRFENCTNEGSILIENGVNPGQNDGGAPIVGYVGGIAGKAVECSFTSCTNAANIDIQATSGSYISAGIAGSFGGTTTLEGCKNSGDLNVGNCTDGLLPCVAYNVNVVGCENTGKITVAYKKIEGAEGSCTEKGVREHYSCTACGTCFDSEGSKLDESELVGDYSHKLGDLIEQKTATCLEDGLSAHYLCSECNNYFDENGQKTTKFALTRVAGHAFGELIAEIGATEEKAGMKAHYECADCKKLFDENKADADEESLTIPMLSTSTQTEPEATEPEATEPQATEPEATKPQTTEPEATEGEGGGCASSLSGIAVAIAALLGGAMIIKKKEGN